MANSDHKEARAVMAYLSERTSEKGRTYFVGWLGHSKLLMFKTADLDKFDNPVWRLIVQEGKVPPGVFHKALDDAAKQGPLPQSEAKPADPGVPFNDPLPF